MCVGWSHEGEKQGANEKSKITNEELLVSSLKKINDLYLIEVMQIFRQKCFDCHGSVDKFPWYSIIPGPKHLIISDIREAKKHLDMSKDFPFGGHATSIEHLKAIEKLILNNTMPPLRYKIMHWGSGLTSEEKIILRKWVMDSLKILNSKTLID